MKHKTQRNIKLGILLSIVAGGLLFAINEQMTGNTFAGAGKKISLPPLGSFTETGGDLDGIIDCNIKQTTTVVDSSGNTITTIQSSGIQGSPSFDLVNPSDNRPVSVIVVIPKISCQNNSGNDLIIDESDLLLTTSAGSNTIKQSLRFQSDIKVPATSGVFQTEKNLGWFSWSDNDIEAGIFPTGVQATTTLSFDVTGNIKAFYANAPQYVMEIPINSGDIKTFWKAENLGDIETETDIDGDGIRDSADACPTVKENFNGYNDHDGCPDTAPSTTEPTTTPEPTTITQSSCNTGGKTWYVTGSTSDDIANGTCSTAYKVTSGELCKAYDTTKKQCINPTEQGDSIPNPETGDPEKILADIKFRVDIKMNDSTMQSYLVQDDPSPLDVDFSLSLVGGIDGNVKRTAEFLVEPRIVFENPQIHKLTTVQASNITIEPIIKVQGTDYTLGAKEVRFVKSNGGAISDNSVGLSLGEIIVKASEIENKVPLSVVPLGSSATVDVRFVVTGNVDLIINNGDFVDKKLDVTGADFQLIGLKVIREDSNSPDPNPSPNCATDENVVTISGVSTCIPKGKTTGDDNHNDPPKIGDENVSICTDNTEFGKGGFPCTLDYRIAYCGAEVDSSGNIIKDSTDCSVPNGDDGNGNNITPSNITPVDFETCPDNNLTSLSLTDNVCTIFTSKTTTNGGLSTSTSAGSPNNDMLWIGAIVVLVIGVAVLVIKKRK